MTTYTKQIFEAVFLSFVLKYNLAHHTSEYINIWAWIVEGIFQFAMITWSQNIFIFIKFQVSPFWHLNWGGTISSKYNDKLAPKLPSTDIYIYMYIYIYFHNSPTIHLCISDMPCLLSKIDWLVAVAHHPSEICARDYLTHRRVANPPKVLYSRSLMHPLHTKFVMTIL